LLARMEQQIDEDLLIPDQLAHPTWTVRALSLFIRILTPSLFNVLIIAV